MKTEPAITVVDGKFIKRQHDREISFHLHLVGQLDRAQIMMAISEYLDAHLPFSVPYPSRPSKRSLRHWLDYNATCGWSFGETVRFENSDDAAMFKLIWS